MSAFTAIPQNSFGGTGNTSLIGGTSPLTLNHVSNFPSEPVTDLVLLVVDVTSVAGGNFDTEIFFTNGGLGGSWAPISNSIFKQAELAIGQYVYAFHPTMTAYPGADVFTQVALPAAFYLAAISTGGGSVAGTVSVITTA